MKYSFITNKKDFFNLLGVSAKKMNYILYNKQFKGPENMYTTFLVPKKMVEREKLALQMES
ncbi:hypothetical protein BU085_12325 [Staphylococcus warneri]|mgnify:CR=1 FL=1|uniref:Uncharacterized protein n=1 Tax=Staphylococcus warneri TaxID=1292 RepID=A0A2T4PXE1_STAWA|nr:hypothetical protein [Staphylococcus warneri]PTI49302.1 hypothetical protein BU085_12325 [Staphylococcus warneri]